MGRCGDDNPIANSRRSSGAVHSLGRIFGSAYILHGQRCAAPHFMVLTFHYRTRYGTAFRWQKRAARGCGGRFPAIIFCSPPALFFKPLRLFGLVSNMGRWPLVVIGIVVGKTLGLGMVVFKLFICNTAGGHRGA